MGILKIAVPLQTPQFDWTKVKVELMKWIQSEFIFNTGSQSEYLQYRIELLGTIKGLVLVLYLSLMMNWKYDHVIAKSGETTNPLISS